MATVIQPTKTYRNEVKWSRKIEVKWTRMTFFCVMDCSNFSIRKHCFRRVSFSSLHGEGRDVGVFIPGWKVPGGTFDYLR